MKYTYTIITLAVILSGLLFAFLLFTNTSNQDQTAEESPTVASVDVTPLSADVSITNQVNQEEWDVITEKNTAGNRSKVRTSADGRAIVARDSEIISSLDNNTEITISLSSDKKESRLALTAGNIWSKVARALEQDEVFEVYTPTMVAAVRGTSFGVSMDPKRSLIVSEGTVYVTRRNPETGELIEGSSISVTAGNTLEDDGTNFKIRITTEADRNTWYYEHNPKTDESGDVTAPQTNPAFVTSTEPPTTTNPQNPTSTPPTTPTDNPAPPSISSVSPRTFDPALVTDFRISGDNLSTVTEVLLNDGPVEFIITATGLIVIRPSELRDGYGDYDVTVKSPAGSDTKNNAFTTEETAPVINVTITNTSLDYSLSEIPTIIVTGTDFDQVDTVLIEGESVAYTLISSTRIDVADYYLQTPVTLTVQGGSDSASATVNP